MLENVHGVTATDQGIQRVSAIHVGDDGRIVATGTDIETDARRIDGDGRMVLPGLIDAHGHILSLGRAFLRVDLVGTRSRSEALDRIQRYAKGFPKQSWVLGRGWNQELWEIKTFPSRQDLDELNIGRPVLLNRIDGHAVWANSKALALAGITRDTPDPPGGEILKDAKGEPTGVLVDGAMDLVMRLVPAPKPEDDAEALTLALAHLVEVGLTSVHDAGVSAEDVELFKRFADNKALSVRVYGMLSGTDENLDAFDEPLRGYGNDRLTVASVKLYQDGALGSRGAALIQAYTDRDDTKGLAFNSLDVLTAMVKKAADKGFQVNVHAIGDQGNRDVLDAFEAVAGGKPSPLRHRIEHAQILALGDIPRFAQLGVIASMQPIHATSDMNMAEDRLGGERILGGYAWRRLLNAKAVIAAGSDFPVEPANPFYGIYAAVSRRDQAGWPEKGWYTDQAMTREEVLKAFTLDAAFAAHQEKELGSLEAGKWADFIVVDRDILSVPEAELWQTKVLQTWVGGELVFDSSDSNN